MAGTVIAGALVTGIKSDLPGDVIGTVTEPVYDTATGKFLLIPQGARILGRYNSRVGYGQSRVQVVWNRSSCPTRLADAGQPCRHRPGRLRGRRMTWTALEPHLCRCGADDAAGRRRRTAAPENRGRQPHRHRRT